MPYSAVTQPRPVLRKKGGTRSSTEAVHSTWVSPKRARHEPSAYLAKPGSRVTGRIASGGRPEGRIGYGSSNKLPCPIGGTERRTGRREPPAITPTLPSKNSSSSAVLGLTFIASVTTRSAASRTTT
jgi:hypothetical protein